MHASEILILPLPKVKAEVEEMSDVEYLLTVAGLQGHRLRRRQ